MEAVRRRWRDGHGRGSCPISRNSIGPLQHLIDGFFASRASQFDETLTTDDDDPPEPEALPTIPGFTVLKRLGRGRHGRGVPRPRSARPRVGSQSRPKKAACQRRAARFLQEARAMAKLKHPHVGRLSYYGEFSGRPYFTMGLYPYTLADRVPEYRGDPVVAVRIMAAVADGVGHLHAAGFVHRDLKPSNILLTEDGRPVVSDFGLVKGRTEGDSSAGDSMPMGRPRRKPTAGMPARRRWPGSCSAVRYMAPEQAAGQNHLAGPSWDTWALGVILHELLTGQLPLSSLAPERLLSPNEPGNPPPTELKPGLDRGSSGIMQRCLGSRSGETLSRWRIGRGRLEVVVESRSSGVSERRGDCWGLCF